ncbi:MAG: glycosyltransferase family 1 protein, partial [Acidobacteriaceae bacterium]
MRVAYFPDSFHEINGVAHTSRHFEGFARRRNLPFLCVRAAPGRTMLRSERLAREGQLTTLEFARGALSFPLDKDLRFDAGWISHLPMMLETVRHFRPDIVHVTG